MRIILQSQLVRTETPSLDYIMLIQKSTPFLKATMYIMLDIGGKSPYTDTDMGKSHCSVMLVHKVRCLATRFFKLVRHHGIQGISE